MWDVLAIAPTDDAKAIRRAYAARLREMDPDRDREAFARLRAALEWALDRAARRASSQAAEEASRDDEPPETVDTVHLSWTPEPAAPADDPATVVLIDDEPAEAVDAVNVHWTLPPAPAREAAPELAGERAQERALMIALEQALQRGDAREAARLYVRAAATGAVPLGDTERMLARLFTVALEDAGFDGAAFRGLAKALGWDQLRFDGAAASDVRQRVLARLGAEGWYDDVVATAMHKNRRSRHEVKVARLLLRRRRGIGLLRINRPLLRTYLDQLKPHQGWLRDRIPPEWAAILEKRMRWRGLIAHGLAMLLIGGLLVDSAAVATVTVMRDGFSPGMALFGLLVALLAWLFKVIAVNFVEVWRQRVP